MNKPAVKLLLSGLMVIGISVFSLFDRSWCETVKTDGNWTAETITVDGQAADWDNIAGFYFENENASVSFCNDDKNLFILFKVRDSRSARAIKMSGITLYLNSDGKKKKDFYIKFKGGPSMETIAAISGESNYQDRMPPEMRYRMDSLMANNSDELILYIKETAHRLISMNGSNGPEAASDTSQGSITYEFRVPLYESQGSSYGLNALLGTKFAIGAEWGGEQTGELKNRKGGGGSGFGGPGEGMGGRGGGMGPGGGMGDPPRGGMRPQGLEKQEIWIETNLTSAGTESQKEN